MKNKYTYDRIKKCEMELFDIFEYDTFRCTQLEVLDSFN